MTNLGERLKELRKEKKLRQKDLANVLGIGQTTIANYEQGLRFPNEKILKSFADFFNVSLDFLLGRIEERECSHKFDFHTVNTTLDLNKQKLLSSILKDYIELCLNGKKDSAINLILNCVQTEVDIEDLYIYVLAPALYEIGSLWEKNKITISQEHYFSQVTKNIIALLYPYISCKNKKTYSIISVAAGGESHDIGLQMVNDFFEMNGWHTYYLGTNTPTESIIDTIKFTNADVIAISATMSFHLDSVNNIIKAIRSSKFKKEIKIIVGGQAFKFDNSLWKTINADGYSSNAKEAVLLAEMLITDSLSKK